MHLSQWGPASEGGSTGAGDLEWNYVKFLVGRDGVPRKRFNSLYNPKDFEGDVSACPISQRRAPLCARVLHDRALTVMFLPRCHGQWRDPEDPLVAWTAS